MLENNSASEQVSQENSERERPITCRELFIGFFGIGIIGFGGVTPWARRMLVEQKRWLTEEEFVNTLSICQILPGANVGNMAVAVGTRFAGFRGAASAALGLYCAPFFIVLLLAAFYSEFADVPLVERLFRGISSAASGLVLSTGLKIAFPVCRTPHAIIVTLLAMSGILILKLPLLWVVFGLAPPSILALWLTGRR